MPILILLGWIPDLLIQESTEYQLKSCINDLCSIEASGEGIILIKHWVSQVQMSLEILGAEDMG